MEDTDLFLRESSILGKTSPSTLNIPICIQESFDLCSSTCSYPSN